MDPNPVKVKDFFISYNQADRAWAEWIAAQLEEEGYTCIISWQLAGSLGGAISAQSILYGT